jgi:hypothetical protein
LHRTDHPHQVTFLGDRLGHALNPTCAAIGMQEAELHTVVVLPSPPAQARFRLDVIAMDSLGECRNGWRPQMDRA